MSKFTSFFKGSKPSKTRETIAELRKQSSEIKIRARALKKLSDEERGYAKESLRLGDKTSAQKALVRRKKYHKDLASLRSKAALVSNVIESIAKSEQNDKLLKVLTASKTVLDSNASVDRLEQAEEVMTNLEMSMENVDYIDERLSESAVLDDPIDFEMADISDEMNVLMSEIQGETQPAKTQIATPVAAPAITPRTKKVGSARKILSTTDDLPGVESNAEDSRDKELRDEIERIKREMREELE